MVVGACSLSTSSLEARNEGVGGDDDVTTSTGGGGEHGEKGDTFVGRSCTDDIECGSHPASHCVTADDSVGIFTSFWGTDDRGGGVAGGYCTRACSLDVPCPEGSRCGGGTCLAVCDFGAPDLPSLDADLPAEKCFGRDELMCVPTSGGDSVCMPNCGAGADCGTRTCDVRFGVCTNPNRDGAALGASCVMDNGGTTENEDLCAGMCLELGEGDDMATVCSSRCSLGGGGDDCGGLLEGACAIPRVDDETGAQSALGDEGFCASACDAHDECAYGAGMFCKDLGNFTTLGVGYCLHAPSCDEDTCDEGQACFQTASGPRCLDATDMDEVLIPLGTAKY